uniref:R3H and coiled-coil domain-containing protein 1 n=1 Tax=Gasterosteus aculeatus aculeatus TaxID=481459 RepID=UPI001A99230F|nr:R3H and coiled-coil domain-containing protein 1 [Gasterosteus aculeatus aculeatus]XP_040060858.1 R3H and coiled-coil domain-containing protein 1 [Gasterosteus aculeatus aculeatus]XP_040060859.1 R3H and coiled-coil domain-containing protein 1 [Gasterosteus aculeatus aculeatus]XP_040060860.1 R3H and coiled-coil domain-containing protein 1 [Gasterosteus aculeatus aculeatus]
MAFPCFDGVYLPKEEAAFLHQVNDELVTYQQENGDHRSVLLFPPLPSRLRYLIHRTLEDLPGLTTFSVGGSWCRRVVVCHSEIRRVDEQADDWESHDSLCEQPLRNREETGGDNAKPKSSISSRGRGPKRPDKPLYMPRAARERLSLQSSQDPSGEHGLPGPASSSFISTSCDSSFCTEKAEKTSTTSRQECPLSVAEGISHHAGDSSAICPQEEEEKLLTVDEDEPLVWQKTMSSFNDMTLEEDETGKEDECTDSDDVTEEIKTHLKELETISIQHVQNDYSMYESVFIIPDKLCHVIEIYHFPPTFKTDDLLDAFADYSDGGMKIEWVDDTHALGVFSNETAAIQALSICHPLLKARALNEGSKKAKGKAVRRAEFIQPVKERPRTDCAVARRMVTRALGMQGRGRRGQRY